MRKWHLLLCCSYFFLVYIGFSSANASDVFYRKKYMNPKNIFHFPLFTVAWFSWAMCAPGLPQEISMSEDAMSASCEGYEHRVVLSTVGFSRGIHYWELTIDRYHSDTDPAFGIARADVSRDQMLGEFEYVIRISSLTKTSIYNNFPSFHNYRQRRQGLEHVHRPSALLVHARRRSRSAYRGWHPTGLDGRSPP